MLAQPRIPYHSCCAAAHQHGFISNKAVVIIKFICVLVARYGTFVNSHLSIVFARGLKEPWQLEQPENMLPLVW